MYIQNNNQYMKFTVDDSSKFILDNPGSESAVIMNDVSCEYDGLCDKDGIYHFLLQTNNGALVYLKFDGETWKKYNIFQNKENIKKITKIKLTYSGNLICAFYVLEHNNKFMLVKHAFSSDKLYITPEITDLLDSKKDFSVCTSNEGDTLIYYRDSAGRIQETVYDKFLVRKLQNRFYIQGDILNFCAVNSGENLCYAYIAVKKNYTTLVFTTSQNKFKEKIITFGISKSTKIALSATGNYITVSWTEGNSVLSSKSSDGGESFTKPYRKVSAALLNRIRIKGHRAGVEYSYHTCIDTDAISYDLPHSHYERMNKMDLFKNGYAKNDTQFKDISANEFTYKLSRIEKEVNQIGASLNEICIFLDKLVKFKTESKKDVFPIDKQKKTAVDSPGTSSDIGEKNEENIKLFEKMDIDEVIPPDTETKFKISEVINNE